jgi:mxaL protein
MPPLAWSAPPTFSAVRGATGGLIIGVGGHDFVPIPKFDKFGREIGVWKAGEVPTETGGLFKGYEHLTAVDEPHLRSLAAETGLTYLHLDNADAIRAPLTRAATPMRRETELDLRAVPASLALVALLAASFGSRRRRRLPGIVGK